MQSAFLLCLTGLATALPVFDASTMLNLNMPSMAEQGMEALQEQIKALQLENEKLHASLRALQEPAGVASTVKDESKPDLTRTSEVGTNEDEDNKSSCTNDGLNVGLQTIQIQSNGMSRKFEIYVPAGMENGVTHKALFMWHGFASTPSKVQGFTDFNAKADSKKWFVIYPVGSGLIKGFNGAGCCPGITADDVQFARDIIEWLKANSCTDKKHIFSTGFSNGGFMTNRLACEVPELFKGFAVHSGLIGNSFACNPSQGVPMLLLHGDEDPTVPYYGNGQWISYASLIDTWATKNNCDFGSAYDSFESSSSACVRIDTCSKDSVPLEYCTIMGLAHKWSGEVRADLDASDYIVKFFDGL